MRKTDPTKLDRVQGRFLIVIIATKRNTLINTRRAMLGLSTLALHIKTELMKTLNDSMATFNLNTNGKRNKLLFGDVPIEL